MSHHSTRMFSVSLVLTTLFWLTPVYSQEAVPRLQISDVLSSELLSGDGYTIDDTVEVHGHRFLFNIQTDYGDISALGLPMLELRLREHQAIQRARELSGDPLILKGIIEVAKDTPVGAKTLIKDPLGSLIRVPKQIKQTVDSVVDPLDRRAGNNVRRELAVSLGADPETRSRVLSRLLDRLAARKSIGRLAAQLSLGAAVPGLGLLAINKEIQEDVRTKTPRQISTELTLRLTELGLAAHIGDAFATSRQMTSTEKLLFVGHLELLDGVQGLESLVAAATKAETESQLLSQLLQVSTLADLHQRQPIRRIYSALIPVAGHVDGQFSGVVAVDYVQGSDDFLTELTKIRRDLKGRNLQLLVTGRVSPEAQRSLNDVDVHVAQLSSGSIR